MRSASPALLSLLNSGDDFEQADIWTITLNGGQVLRWTDADIDLVSGSQTYTAGPVLERGRVSDRTGLETSTLDLSITADENDTVNGVPIIQFISRRGLDGANVDLKRAFLPRWGAPVTGEILRFSEGVTSIDEISGNTARVTVSSWMILLNVNFPPDLYQVPCLNTVYDSKCGLNRADWQATGAVASGTHTVLQFPTNLSATAGRYSQGTITFTSGPNSGISRSVRSSAGDGTVSLVQPLPTPPGAGDTFTILPGCDLTRGTCLGKFNNLLRHRGFPFVPSPETAV